MQTLRKVGTSVKILKILRYASARSTRRTGKVYCGSWRRCGLPGQHSQPTPGAMPPAVGVQAMVATMTRPVPVQMEMPVQVEGRLRHPHHPPRATLSIPLPTPSSALYRLRRGQPSAGTPTATLVCGRSLSAVASTKALSEPSGVSGPAQSALATTALRSMIASEPRNCWPRARRSSL